MLPGERGCYIQYDEVNRQMLVSSLQVQGPSFGQRRSEDRGIVALLGIVLCS